MPLLRSLALIGAILFAAAVSADDKAEKLDNKEVFAKIVGKWQGVKGSVTPVNFITFDKFGSYKTSRLRSDVVVDGKKLPPTEFGDKVGTFTVKDGKLTLKTGPFKMEKITELAIVKVTDSSLVVSPEKGKNDEFKRVEEKKK